MHNSVRTSLRSLGAAILMSGVASIAIAGGQPDVNWSVTIGSPQPAPRIYAPPAVYVQPQPVYIRPQPVYIRPATIVQYDAPYYVEEVRYKKRHHWKHRHHRDDDDD